MKPAATLVDFAANVPMTPADIERDMDAAANGDVEPEPPKPDPFVRAPALRAALDDSAKLAWVELRLVDGGEPLVRGPVGAYCVLVGWEGSGKSSIVMQVGIVAARAGLAFIYLITELGLAEVGARIVGIQTGHSWEEAHRGLVPIKVRDAALEMPGFVVLAGDAATMANVETAVAALRKEDPDRSIVLAGDYLQDLDVDARDERAKVSAASRMLRRAAKRLGTFTLAVSQTSRAGRQDLRSGDAIGAETATKGAESSQIERDAYVMLALGNPQEQADGTILMDLSIGKGRMRAGDKVYPLVFDGRTGRSHLAGEARSAGDVRKERGDERTSKKRETVKPAIVALVSKSAAPMSKADITGKVAGSSVVIADAIKELVREGLLAHDFGAMKGGHPQLWTPANIAARVTKEGAES